MAQSLSDNFIKLYNRTIELFRPNGQKEKFTPPVDRLESREKAALFDWYGGSYVNDALIENCRKFANNNPLIDRYLTLLSTNVIGTGIDLQINGEDSGLTKMLSAQFKKYADKANLSGDSWQLSQQQILTRLAIDGAVLVVMVKTDDSSVDGFQIIPVTELDRKTTKTTMPGGIRVKDGIELDKYNRKIAYHFLGNQVVPAKSVALLTIPPVDGIGLLGKPWIASALNMLNSANSLVASTLQREDVASRFIFKQTLNEDAAERYAASLGAETAALNGRGKAERAQIAASQPRNQIASGDPKMIVAAAGTKLDVIENKGVNPQLTDFLVTVLQQASSGLNCSYHALTGDFARVNFSTYRASIVQDRAYYRTISNLLIDAVLEPLAQRWMQNNNISVESYDWALPKFDYLDPYKERQSQKIALQMRVISATEIAAQEGRDIDTVYQNLGRELELSKTYGLPTNIIPDTDPVATEPDPDAVTDNDGENSDLTDEDLAVSFQGSDT